MRKLTMLEKDLDTAEDRSADTNAKNKDLETQVEELQRENKQLKHRIDLLEGKFNLSPGPTL